MMTPKFTQEDIEMLSHYELGLGRSGVLVHLEQSLPYAKDALSGDFAADLIDKLKAASDTEFATVMPAALQLAQHRRQGVH